MAPRPSAPTPSAPADPRLKPPDDELPPLVNEFRLSGSPPVELPIARLSRLLSAMAKAPVCRIESRCRRRARALARAGLVVTRPRHRRRATMARERGDCRRLRPEDLQEAVQPAATRYDFRSDRSAAGRWCPARRPADPCPAAGMREYRIGRRNHCQTSDYPQGLPDHGVLLPMIATPVVEFTLIVEVDRREVGAGEAKSTPEQLMRLRVRLNDRGPRLGGGQKYHQIKIRDQDSRCRGRQGLHKLHVLARVANIEGAVARNVAEVHDVWRELRHSSSIAPSQCIPIQRCST